MANDIVNYDAAFAASAAQYAEQEKGGSAQFLSIRGGVMRIGDDELPGNQLCVVIIDSILENTYYDSRFDPESMDPPKCYAFGRGGGADMMPHLESMALDKSYFMPQHFKDGAVQGCTGCPQAEWGTSNTGKGKACSNRRRLALLPAGVYTRPRGQRDFDVDVYDDPKHYEAASIAYLKLPVTSVANFGKYVQTLAASGTPIFGAITRIFVEPDPKTQFKVCFEQVVTLPVELRPAIFNRHSQEIAKPFEGYQPPTKEEPGAGAKGAGFRNFGGRR